ncbi:MAG: fluoride efflux transporter CrcB [Dongiaceae bacterium]
MKVVLAVAAGGAIGATARHLLIGAIGRLLGDGFPWGTLIVNVLGCFIMGALTEVMALRWNIGLELRALLTVGTLGGFTTFSSFALDTALLNERASYGMSLAYVLASVLLSVLGFYAGLVAIRQGFA